MNREHVALWTARLRDPELVQVKGLLTRLVYPPRKGDGSNDERGDLVLGFCCLGVGSKVAGVPMVATEFDDPAEEDPPFTFGEEYEGQLAPVEFVRWLGFEANEWDGGADLRLDVPTGPEDALHYQGREGAWPDRPDSTKGVWIGSLAALNDDGFTFAQIADLIDYFGIREP